MQPEPTASLGYASSATDGGLAQASALWGTAAIRARGPCSDKDLGNMMEPAA